MSAFTTTLLRAPLAPAVRVRVRATRRASRVARGRAATIAPRAGPDGIDRDDELNTGVLYERMKKLMETEKEETDAAVDAAIERQQAIEAGIRGDAAEREIKPGDHDQLIEHLLSTPMEAMDYETVRCGPLMTPEFRAHLTERIREAAARGPLGDDVLCELQALEKWTIVARERQEERDDALRRRARNAAGASSASDANVWTPADQAMVDGGDAFGPAGPTPVRTVGDKFRIIMAAASNGVDDLRGAIVQLARSGEIDDALVAILQGNAASAEEEGDAGRAKFMRKVAEACLREKEAAGW